MAMVCYPDYSKSKSLKVTHGVLGRIRHLPVRGMSRITDLLVDWLPKPNPKGPCIVKTAHGFKMLVDSIYDKGIERIIFNYGTYEEGTLRIMNNILRGGGTFIDIGAHIGLMSLHASKILQRNGKVVSFEPLRSSYDILKKNIELNNFKNIEAVNAAVGSTNGTNYIYGTRQCRDTASLINPIDYTGPCHKTSIICLDDYLEQQNLDNINYIKIDAEGWELEVLKGANNTLSGFDAPFLIVECRTEHPMQGGDARDLFYLLSDINSYRIFCLARGNEKPSKLLEVKTVSDLPKHDNLFCFMPEHIRRFPSRLFSKSKMGKSWCAE